jgi:hypothetical protein
MANLHNIRGDKAKWAGAALVGVKRTDIDRLEAEVWLPPAFRTPA